MDAPAVPGVVAIACVAGPWANLVPPAVANSWRIEIVREGSVWELRCEGVSYGVKVSGFSVQCSVLRMSCYVSWQWTYIVDIYIAR